MLGDRRGLVNGRGAPANSWTQGCGGDNGAVLQWPGTTAAGREPWLWLHHQHPELLQQLGGTGSSMGVQEVNPGQELPILLNCLILPWAGMEWQTPGGWCRNRVDLMVWNLVSSTLGTLLCSGAKAAGLEGYQQAAHELSQEWNHLGLKALLCIDRKDSVDLASYRFTKPLPHQESFCVLDKGWRIGGETVSCKWNELSIKWLTTQCIALVPEQKE